MTVTAADIKSRYPEFSAMTDEQIDPVLIYSASVIRQERWKGLTDAGIEALTAHELAVKYRHRLLLGQGLRAIASDGDQTTFGAKGESYYELSPYGVRYKRMLDDLPSMAMRVI